MSFKSKLRVLTVCLILQAGVFMHCPMRLEQIEEMMQQMNQPKLARVLPSDEDDGDGPQCLRDKRCSVTDRCHARF